MWDETPSSPILGPVTREFVPPVYQGDPQRVRNSRDLKMDQKQHDVEPLFDMEVLESHNQSQTSTFVIFTSVVL